MSRLIDADDLWEKMYRYSDNEGAKMPYGDDDSLIHKDSACFLIENAPTIEPERKKGKWVGAIEYCKHLEETTGERYQPSSLAGMIYCNQCWKASDRRSNYCRECGSYNWEGGDPI